MNNRRAIFLDRDGVINELRIDPMSSELESPLSVADVALMPDVTKNISKLQRAGYLIIAVTNQPSAAKGRITEETQDAIQRRVVELLAEEGVTLDDWKICPHHPDGIIDQLTKVCECRKPKPGMLIEAAIAIGIDMSHSWMIGDSDTDVEAGFAAGTSTILLGAVETKKRQYDGPATFECVDLTIAVEMIIAH